MEFFMDIFQMCISNMGVDLGCRDITMSEQRLYGTQVGAIHQQVCRKTVPQGMRGDMFGDSGGAGILFYNSLNTPRCESPVIARCRGDASIFAIV